MIELGTYTKRHNKIDLYCPSKKYSGLQIHLPSELQSTINTYNLKGGVKRDWKILNIQMDFLLRMYLKVCESKSYGVFKSQMMAKLIQGNCKISVEKIKRGMFRLELI
jgi:hypothetical protein